MPIDFSNLAVVGTGIVSIGTLLWTIYNYRRSDASTLRRQIDEDNSIRRKQLEETIIGLKSQIADSEKRCGEELRVVKDENAKQHAQLQAEISGFKAAILEKDAHILSLTAILQGRNPEMISLLNEIKDHLIDNRRFSQEMHTQNKEILDYQTEILEKGDVRSDKLDLASKQEEGKAMRVPVK